MAFTFDSEVIISPTTFSQICYGVDDGSTGLTSQQIAQIQFAVNSANKKILSYCSRKFIQATYTEVWDGANSDEILTREWPITGVTSIIYDYRSNFSAGTPIDTTFYYFYDQSIVFHGNITPFGRAAIQVIYTAGYPLASMPYDLQMALILQFKMDYKLLNPGTTDPDQSMLYSGASKMGESFTKNKTIDQFGLTKEVMLMLEPYRRVDFPASRMFLRVT